MNTLVCVSCQEYVLHDPYQCDCGDRLCIASATPPMLRGIIVYAETLYN